MELDVIEIIKTADFLSSFIFCDGFVLHIDKDGWTLNNQKQSEVG